LSHHAEPSGQCSPWVGQWIGHGKHGPQFFSVPHSQAAEVMLKNICWQTQWKHLSKQFCCQFQWQW